MISEGVKIDNAGFPTRPTHFIHDGRQEGAGYFVGYHGKSFHRIGYLGKAGFTRIEPPRSDQFAVDGRDLYFRGTIRSHQRDAILTVPNTSWRGHRLFSILYLCSEGRLYEVDLRNRAVKTLLENDALILDSSG